MNKTIWRNHFDTGGYIPYPCPNCEIGTLNLLRIHQELLERPPILESQVDEFEYYSNLKEGERYSFAAILRCSNIKCHQTVAMIGEYVKNYENWSDETGSVETFSSYFPKHFYPNLKMFKYPTSITKEIENDINLSFSNFFNDTASSANKIRRAIELLVTVLGAPKYTLTKKIDIRTGKRKKHYFNLDTRITKLQKSKKRTGEMLLGLKVIGNEGSHSNNIEIKHKDILEAYEVLEFILEKEFAKRENDILKKADKLKNRKK